MWVVWSGNVLNEVEFGYNGFSQPTITWQAHAGSVDPMTSPTVQSGYANGANNTVRPTSLTYPNGRVLHYDYGSAGGMDDQLSRVGAIVDDEETPLAEYSYLGLGTVAIQRSPQPGIENTLLGTLTSSGDPYTAIDRFGRLRQSLWVNSSSAALSDVRYGYNPASSRLWRRNATDPNDNHDWLYQYDGLQRLKEAERGTLNSTQIGLTSAEFAQCWSLDTTGNWEGFRQSDNGSTWGLVQDRSSNDVNEITAISASTGPTWATPTYDRNGNMTGIPQTANPTLLLGGTYDAWNRLVKVEDDTDTVAEYEYDARNYRIVTKSYVDNALDETRHTYYTNGWQAIEERINSESTPDRQWVWGIRYIDDLILRDRTTSSTLDERLYALQDANWNVTAVVDDGGTVQERYEYDPYGITTVLTSAFSPRTSSEFAWETTYCGYRWEDAVGLYAVRFRWYAPRLATWVSRDPVRYAAGINLYAYVNGMPTGSVDPYGLLSKKSAKTIVETMLHSSISSGFDATLGSVAAGTIEPTNENCNNEIMNKIWGEGASNALGETTKDWMGKLAGQLGKLEQVQGAVDELGELKQMVEGVLLLRDLVENPNQTITDTLLDQLSQRTGIPKSILKNSKETAESIAVGKCQTVELGWNPIIIDPKQSASCSFLVCADVERGLLSSLTGTETVKEWTIVGFCEYTCVPGTKPCCCGTSRSFSFNRSGTGLGE